VLRKHQPAKWRKLIFHHKPTLPMTYCLCETRCGSNRMCNRGLQLNVVIVRQAYLEDKCVLANSISLLIYLVKVHKSYDKKGRLLRFVSLQSSCRGPHQLSLYSMSPVADPPSAFIIGKIHWVFKFALYILQHDWTEVP
jgi:hypothetical protein